MEHSWSPAPGERVILRLAPDGEGVPVRITARAVTAARETLFQRFIHTPAIWASTLAALALVVLVSTAFATGTIRPAPPHVSGSRRGGPTPTPDARPILSIGGFVLQPPARSAVESTSPQPSAGSQVSSDQPAAPGPYGITAAASSGPAEESAADAEPAPSDTAQGAAPPPTPACTNLFGLGCTSRQTQPNPARPPQPAPGRTAAVQADAADSQFPATDQAQPPADVQPAAPQPPAEIQPAPPQQPQPEPPSTSVVAVPSPAAFGPGPQPGSNLDTALRVASLANDRFNRALANPSDLPAQPGPDDR